MKIGDTHSGFRSTGHALARRCVEECSSISVLQHQTQRDRARDAAQSPPLGRGEPSRYETRTSSQTEQIGIAAGFIAQVLGQILETNREHPLLAARAYARSHGARAPQRLIRVL